MNLKKITLHFFTQAFAILVSVSATQLYAEESPQFKHDMEQLQAAEKAGLSAVMKAISPEGGEFELLSDGGVRIIPSDSSKVLKLLEGSKATTDKNSADSQADKTKESNSSEVSQKLSSDELRFVTKIQEADKAGLSRLLEKFAAKGGSFKLMEDGVILIVPDDPALAKGVLGASEKIITTPAEDKQKEAINAVEPPINTREKARNIVMAWLIKENYSELKIGSVVRAAKLYTVSILAKKSSQVKYQLVIRIKDGKTIVFDKQSFHILGD